MQLDFQGVGREVYPVLARLGVNHAAAGSIDFVPDVEVGNPNETTHIRGVEKQSRETCETQGKLMEFNCLGEFVLRTLWESGLEPSVQALTGSAAKTRPLTKQDEVRVPPRS
jgi:hypothetical protein